MHAYYRSEPLPRGGGYEFLDKIVGGVIDQSLRPSVIKAYTPNLKRSILAGYPIVDVRVSRLTKNTSCGLKDIAFQIAGPKSSRKPLKCHRLYFLNPVVELKVTVPEEYTGDIMGICLHAGKIGGMSPSGRIRLLPPKFEAEGRITPRP